MRTKKETITDVLQSGTSKKDSILTPWGSKEEVLKNANKYGKYQYPQNWDVDELLKRERALARREKEVREYGAGGRKFFNRVPKTQEILAKLQDNKEECRIYHALYQKSLQAPRHLQEYVFHNLTEWMKDHGTTLQHECTWYAAAILPPAWKEGWEGVNLSGRDIKIQIEDLLPAAGFEIGTEVMTKHRYYDPLDGYIIGYKYVKKRNRYVLVYDVKYGEKSYEHCTFRLDELSVAHAVAS